MLNILKEKSGLAAIEFAIVAPALITLLLGSIELCNALECNQKVTSVASSLANLVAQTSSVTSADVSGIFSAGNYVLYPFPSTASIVISSIVNSSATGTSKNTVCWSQAQNGTPLADGTLMTVPTGVIASGGSAILVQVNYSYNSPVTKLLFSTLPMASTYYASPRESTQVALNGQTC